MSVNLLGSLSLVFSGSFEIEKISPSQRAFLFTVFWAGLLLFSTFMLENFSLLRDKEYNFALQNLL
jgi:fluoride ion exporter CrcB/FEX